MKAVIILVSFALFLRWADGIRSSTTRTHHDETLLEAKTQDKFPTFQNWQDQIKGVGKYRLQETTPPAEAFGGEIFHIQPLLSLTDDTGAIATDFVGDVYATILSAPTGFESLKSAGNNTAGGIIAVPFSGGVS